MTRHERKLWYEFLRNYNFRFQRQKAIGDYIVDFYCAKAGLAIELDGGGHYTEMQIEKDIERTRALKDLGINVLRICNTDIDKNFDGVCEYIDLIIKSLPLMREVAKRSFDGGRENCCWFDYPSVSFCSTAPLTRGAEYKKAEQFVQPFLC